MTDQPTAWPQAAPLYRFSVGNIVVTALGDGDFAMPIAMLPTATQSEADVIHHDAFLPTGDTFSGSVNSYLIATGDSLTLIDAGGRDFLQPTLGQLPDALQAAGVAPDQIDRVVLTHMHPDHIGGIIGTDGAPAFPKATLHVHAADHAFFLDPKMKEAFPPDLALFFDCAMACAAAYADKTHLFAYGDDLGHGLTVVDLAGHSPGHSGFRVSAQGQDLLILGDIVHATALQFARPDWGVAFDADPEAAAASRRRALEAAASERCLIAGMHIPFPGIGRVSKAGDGYRFHPEPWSYRV